MKKVGIVTLNDNYNYGNRLQNYAVQELIKEIDPGIQVITIRNYPITNKKCSIIENLFRILKRNYIEIKRYIKSDKKRLKKFKKFNKKIEYSNKIFSWMNINYFNEFDLFFVGSDQVWNPNYRMSDLELLSFSSKNKNIAFSASLAVDEFPIEKIEYAKKSFNNFKLISVRENRGKEIIEEITDRGDIEVLLDPTMLLKTEVWENMVQRPNISNSRFILNYFLGSIPDSWDKEIKKIAQEYDCEIINVLCKDDKFYQCGPEEFLYLEKNAFLVCTDSFHSCAFAILFKTPFVVFDRCQKNIKSMNSRIDTLLKKFELEKRRFNGKIEEDLLKKDYVDIDKKLCYERQKARSFMIKALND